MNRNGDQRAPGALCGGLIILGTMTKRYRIIAVAAMLSGLLASCSVPDLTPAMRPLSKDAMMLLGKKGMKTEAPILVRIFKEESELEVWKARDDGRYYHFKTYPICTWSGQLGPKQQQGDRQAPEGFYTISKTQMNPNSNFHLAFNIGYPNAYDRAWGRTGDALMVHGKCKSVGCYAMTDALMEEIYALAREQFLGGQDSFPVHAFPFRMTAENMARHSSDPWYPFWQTLKEGYDYFEAARLPPAITVCEKRYNVNVQPMLQNASMRITAEGRCPTFVRPPFSPFVPSPKEQMAEVRIKAPGPKMRMFASSDPAGAPTPAQPGAGNVLSGLTKNEPGRAPVLGFNQ